MKFFHPETTSAQPYPDHWHAPDLHQAIALVTGASRGAGKAIAGVLGECGATVYVTGRSSRQTNSTEGLPGTIEETAELVTRRGGTGIAIRCDHTNDSEVEAVFAAIRGTFGRLDLLINNVWGGYEGYTRPSFSWPFWEQPVRHWDRMFTAGVRAHFVASSQAARLMVPKKRGMLINTIAWAFGEYLGNLYYDVAKSAIIRMTSGMAKELLPFNIGAFALAPGFMRTERVMQAHARQPFDLTQTESPEYVGRAVACLAADGNAVKETGTVLTAGLLARKYGFTDIDGTQPEPYRIPG